MHIFKISNKSEPCILLLYWLGDRGGGVHSTSEILISDKLLWVSLQSGWNVSALPSFSAFQLCPRDIRHKQVKEQQPKLQSGSRRLCPAWTPILNLDAR